MIKFLQLFSFMLFVACAPMSAAKAADDVGAHIAVVDVQSLLKKSKAGQAIEKQLQDIRKDFQAKVASEEKTLRAAEKELVAQKDKLSEEQFKGKAKDFQKKVEASQKKIREQKDKLDKALAEAIGTLRGEIVKIVAEIGEKQNLDMVMARTDVVIVSKKMDITDDVLAKVNKSLPDVKVKVE